MRILYSKNSVKRLLEMSDDTVARILRTVKGAETDPPTSQVQVLSGYTDRRMIARVGTWTILMKRTVFKGNPVFYVMEILDPEEAEYYFT